MNDLTKKTLSTMWDETKQGLKTLLQASVIGSLGLGIIIAGGKILQKVSYDSGLGPVEEVESYFLSTLYCFVLFAFGISIYNWYYETKLRITNGDERRKRITQTEMDKLVKLSSELKELKKTFRRKK